MPVIDLSKKHNYLLVDDSAGYTHFLDRYAARPDVTLCGEQVSLSEIEWDPMGYFDGVDCVGCRAELETRVSAGAE